MNCFYEQGQSGINETNHSMLLWLLETDGKTQMVVSMKTHEPLGIFFVWGRGGVSL